MCIKPGHENQILRTQSMSNEVRNYGSHFPSSTRVNEILKILCQISIIIPYFNITSSLMSLFIYETHTAASDPDKLASFSTTCRTDYGCSLHTSLEKHLFIKCLNIQNYHQIFEPLSLRTILNAFGCLMCNVFCSPVWSMSENLGYRDI